MNPTEWPPWAVSAAIVGGVNMGWLLFYWLVRDIVRTEIGRQKRKGQLYPCACPPGECHEDFTTVGCRLARQHEAQRQT